MQPHKEVPFRGRLFQETFNPLLLHQQPMRWGELDRLPHLRSFVFYSLHFPAELVPFYCRRVGVLTVGFSIKKFCSPRLHLVIFPMPTRRHNLFTHAVSKHFFGVILLMKLTEFDRVDIRTSNRRNRRMKSKICLTHISIHHTPSPPSPPCTLSLLLRPYFLRDFNINES